MSKIRRLSNTFSTASTIRATVAEDRADDDTIAEVANYKGATAEEHLRKPLLEAKCHCCYSDSSDATRSSPGTRDNGGSSGSLLTGDCRIASLMKFLLKSVW
jgi:hypothetical protein